MARFYGTVQGGRGKASRLGHGTTGLEVSAKSHSGDIEIRMFDVGGEDHVQIHVVPHGNFGYGKQIYSGPVKSLLDQGDMEAVIAAFVGSKLTDGQHAAP
jgi:hypothetical protein